MSENPDWLGIAKDSLSSAAKGAAAGSVVPGIGTVVGGLVGLASGLVPYVFGPEAQPALAAAAQAITYKADEAEQLEVLTTSPSAANEFKLEALRIAAEAKKAERVADLEVLRAELANTAGARAQTLALAQSGSVIAWGAPVLSVIIVVGFYGSLALLIWRPSIPDAGVAAMVNMLVGAIVAGFACVTSYWLGSSAGSARKDDRLASERKKP